MSSSPYMYGLVDMPKEVDLQLLLSTDLNTLIQLYKTQTRYRRLLDNPYVLQQLAAKYGLPQAANTFQEWLKEYDIEYGTKQCTKYRNPSQCAANAAKHGNIGYVDYILDTDREDTELFLAALRSAAEAGHNELVEHLIEDQSLATEPDLQDLIVYGPAVSHSIKGGHFILAESLASRMQDQVLKQSHILDGYAIRGDLLAVQRELDILLAIDPNYSLSYTKQKALENGQIEVYDYLASKTGKLGTREEARLSVKAGRLDLVKRFTASGKVAILYEAAKEAAYHGKNDILAYLIPILIPKLNDPRDLQDLIDRSTYDNNLEGTILLIEAASVLSTEHMAEVAKQAAYGILEYLLSLDLIPDELKPESSTWQPNQPMKDRIQALIDRLEQDELIRTESRRASPIQEILTQGSPIQGSPIQEVPMDLVGPTFSAETLPPVSRRISSPTYMYQYPGQQYTGSYYPVQRRTIASPTYTYQYPGQQYSGSCYPVQRRTVSPTYTYQYPGQQYSGSYYPVQRRTTTNPIYTYQYPGQPYTGSYYPIQ